MSIKMSVQDILDANRAFKRKEELLAQEKANLRKINSSIDLDEVRERLSYEETKALKTELYYVIDSAEVKESLNSIVQAKKEEEYPQILGVYYYPQLMELKDTVDMDTLINLDKLLRKSYNGYSMTRANRSTLVDTFGTDIVESLIKLGLLERQYSFSCNCCSSSDCYDEILTQKDVDEFYKYHEFDYDTATPEEQEVHEEDFKKGYIYVGCWNDGDYEICDIKDFEENLKSKNGLKILVAPDLTLENL